MNRGFAVTAVAVLCVLSLMLMAASPARGFALRLEKDVPESSITGKPTIKVQLYASSSAANSVATQFLNPRAVWVSVYTNLVGEKLYRVRLDFTETAALTSAMDLWWEFSISGNLVGSREPVPQAAWSLFAVEADTLDGQHGSYYRTWGSLTGIPTGFSDGVDNSLDNCVKRISAYTALSSWYTTITMSCNAGEFAITGGHEIGNWSSTLQCIPVDNERPDDVTWSVTWAAPTQTECASSTARTWVLCCTL